MRLMARTKFFQPLRCAASTFRPTGVSHDTFVQYVRSQPEGLPALVLTFCLRLSDCETRAEVLAQRGAAERLGRLLLQLAAGPAARPDRQVGHVIVEVTHGEIARMAAMSRPHVTVTLGRFRRLRVIPAHGASVRLEVTSAAGTVTLIVSDTGAGISPELLPHVFDRFRRGDASLRGRRGLGLGLSIAKDIVREHGGTITAESPGPGLGSTFTVSLPAVVAESGPETQDRPPIDES